MVNRRRWKEVDIIDSFAEIRMVSWRYFINFIYKEMLNFETYIWRGQRRDDWLLESTIARLRKKAKITKTKSSNFYAQHLEQFKYAVRGRRGSNPPKLETENDWWALGQHYGLATPLLDWTTSPFVAAYFAFIGEGERRTTYRAIYALHRPSVETKANELHALAEEQRKKKLKELESGGKSATGLGMMAYTFPTKREVEFIRPFSDENQRLVNQGGLFTRFPENIDIQSWVQSKFKGDEKEYTLMKILIHEKYREECLKSLNRMNINHLTLFPDLYGASKFCNIFGEIEEY